MPTHLVAKKSLAQIPCNASNASESNLESKALDKGKLRDRHNKFKQMTHGDISSGEARNLIRYANFRAQDVGAVLGTSGCKFVRIYNGIEPDGTHISFMVPLDAQFKPISAVDAVYTDPCCACPPATNCEENGDLG